jgi:hypothetical protein
MGNRALYLVGLFTTVVSTICCGMAWNLNPHRVSRHSGLALLRPGHRYGDPV